MEEDEKKVIREYEKYIVTFINSAQQRNLGYVVSEDGKINWKYVLDVSGRMRGW